MKKALLNSACSLVDTAVTRAEQLRTQAAVNYAKKAVASLSPLCDAQTIRAFNQRLGAVSK